MQRVQQKELKSDGEGSEDTALSQLVAALELPTEWSNHSNVKKLQVCKIASSSSSQPLRIIYSITVLSDLSWSMYVHDRKLPPATCSVL